MERRLVPLTIPANGRSALVERTEMAAPEFPRLRATFRHGLQCSPEDDPAAFASVGRLKAEEEALAIMERRIPRGPTYLADFF
ncbi:hypothetical protein [Cohnella faecalis]|uniref:Enhanced intracellular survival protein domain-containing protein n=1 Tax=Cohnella faecalis TaxID=2315694 RepID=A0A398CPR6_9BACL|nr:hypothetical protein [Cohnella faecalis]RIE05406.1 hypothetical protein D3H35_00525 [Cohnella faecalis]